MSITLFERPLSRQSSGAEPSVTFSFGAIGETNEQTVHAYVAAHTPAVYSSVYGLLHRQDIRLEPRAYNHFDVTVPYGKRKRTTGEWTFSFDTTGGTVHITHSKETRNRYAPGGNPFIPDHERAIGVFGDQIEGAEIVIPALKINVHFRHPLGAVTLARAKLLAEYTGAVNSEPFLTFAAGEVLFLGAVGSDGSEAEAEVGYQFACSKNRTGLTIGAIADIVKRGWDLIWVKWKDDVDTGHPVKAAEYVYVERVYEEADLATVLGFG